MLEPKRIWTLSTMAWLPVMGIAGLAALLGTGCTTLFAPDERPAQPVPEAYRAAGQSGVTTNQVQSVRWWERFNDTQLDQLVARALTGNLGVAQAAARLRQAEATAVASGAARFPELSGEASASRRWSDGGPTGSAEGDSYALGVRAAYEVDLWGRVGAGYRAALETVESTRLDVEAAAMSVASEVALTYFAWLQQSLTLATLESQLAANEKMFSVIEMRFRTAQADSVDFLQQRQRVAGSRAALPLARAQLAQLYNRLAILVGEAPQADLGITAVALPPLPGIPPAGVPSDLLEQRPDIRSAQHRLDSSDWSVSVARANRLPALRLTGSAAYGADDFNLLLDQWAANLAAGLVAPLIDGGARRAEVERRRAVVDERVASYRELVLRALGEVDDALKAEDERGQYAALVLKQYAAAAQTAEESLRRYSRGIESYFNALNFETARQNLEIVVLRADYDLLAERVRLCRALGGDWRGVDEIWGSEAGQAEMNGEVTE
jgi:multidrug efflux system outer membrane protein